MRRRSSWRRKRLRYSTARGRRERRKRRRHEIGEGGAGEDLPTLSVGSGINIIHALTALGFTPSNKEAKRKIAEGAVRLDDVTMNDPGLIGAER